MTKTAQLLQYMQSHNIDVALIQETKLTEVSRFKGLEGFAVHRTDRPYVRNSAQRRGGGLITLVKEGLLFKTIQCPQTLQILEHQTIELKMGHGQQPLRITNVYFPPIRHTPNEPRITDDNWPDTIPVYPWHIISGDFNAHAEDWEYGAVADERADRLNAWISENGYQVLNNPRSTTRSGRGGCADTSPDISLASEYVAPITNWNVEDALSSDHKPIVMELTLQTLHQKTDDTQKHNWKKADWTKYRSFLEKQKMPQNLNVHRQAQWLATTMRTAKKRAVPLKRASNMARSYWNDDLTQKSHTLNEIRVSKGIDSEEWKTARQQLDEDILQAKRDHWRDKLNTLKEGQGTEALWRTIRKLDDKEVPTPRGQVLMANGREYCTDRQKAQAFVQQYAEVSRLFIAPHEQIHRKKLSQQMRTTTDNELPHWANDEFDMRELDVALSQIEEGKSAGPDEVEPQLLTNVPHNIKEHMLTCFNLSWRTGEVPSTWRQAEIIPIPKPGKDASQPTNYRPISLTPTMAKLMERMIANRLGRCLEERHFVNRWQAGFQRLRSTEEQCVRLSQEVWDNFQSQPMKRTVACFLDCSLAYDRVWKERLIIKMMDAEIPMKMTGWIKSFLEDRKARVRFGSDRSGWRRMHQGLPQGSVLAPMLFLLYVNDLGQHTQPSVRYSGYADDLAVWSHSENIATAVASVQQALNDIAQWTDENKIILNPNKSEAILFTTRRGETLTEGSLTIKGQATKISRNARFLGVTYDPGLHFLCHVKNTTDKARRRTHTLRALANKEWGMDQKDLLNVFRLLVNPVLMYAAPAWMPWISNTNMEALERTQKIAIRVICGLPANTADDAVWMESGVVPARVQGQTLSALTHEHALRMPPDHPIHQLASLQMNNRFRRQRGWRDEARNYTANAIGEQHERVPFPEFRWIPGGARVKTSVDTLSGTKGTLSEAEQLQEATTKVIEIENNTDIQVYTDGSVGEGQQNGGFGFVIIENGTVTHRECGPAGRECISYEAKVEAMSQATMWLQEQLSDVRKRIAIVTDSMAVVMAVKSARNYNDAALLHLMERLITLTNSHEVELHWVPSHVGISGNEEADLMAEMGTHFEQPLKSTWKNYTTDKRTIQRDIQPAARTTQRPPKRASTSKSTKSRLLPPNRTLPVAHQWRFNKMHQMRRRGRRSRPLVELRGNDNTETD
jgi:ribonuclease HI